MPEICVGIASLEKSLLQCQQRVGELVHSDVQLLLALFRLFAVTRELEKSVGIVENVIQKLN